MRIAVNVSHHVKCRAKILFPVTELVRAKQMPSPLREQETLGEEYSGPQHD